MKAGLKLLIGFILVFGFLAIGIETFRIVKLNMDIEKQITIICDDAIELSMDDEFRIDHVSIIDRNLCEELICHMLMDKFNLDSGLNPKTESYLAGPLQLIVFDIEEGQYKISGDKPIQKTNPHVWIKGSVEIQPMIINFNKNITIKFKVYSDNERFD
ncbi:MAG: hypothetical protein N4A68_11760 [Maledivibacter sp.]|nr:hypothetical protein [Maledivibacter sp.]